jgi:putative colanic acid biosynthesis UDP-glucose lipid carrier transferase
MLPRGLLKEHAAGLALLTKLIDMLLVYIAGWSAHLFKFNISILPFHYLSAILIGVLLLPVYFSFFGLYQPMRGRESVHYLNNLFQALVFYGLSLAGLAFLTKSGEDFSRIWFLLWMSNTAIFLLIFRCSLFIILRYMRSLGMNERRVLVIGTSDLANKLANNIQEALWTGFRLVSFVEDCHLLGKYLTKKNIDEVWIALPAHAVTTVKSILHELRHHTMTVRFILDVDGLNLFQQKVTYLAGMPMVNICSTPMVGINRLLKALEDRILAAFILFLISPLLLLIAIVIKFTSPGPVFYRQKRVGWNGREFEMLKFRTMPVDAEVQTGPVWATSSDQRPTKLGKILRRISFDELPQFINVLLGDMSIVGPRPERKVFVDEFSESIPRYMQKHLVKAGITGWAQVNGWRGNTSLEKRIEYDLFYIENWSLIFDLKIIFLTLLRGFIHRNAY